MTGHQIGDLEQEKDSRSDLRLGQVLIDIGMISEKNLAYALDVAKHVGLPVGRVLVMSSFVSEKNFQAGVQIQSLLKDNLLDFKTAKRVASLIVNTDVALEQALETVGWQQPEEIDRNQLGPLLVNAGFVTRDQLNDALMKSRSSGVPFGRLLVLNGVLTENLLSSALNAQILIRDGKVSREQAIHGLRSAKKRSVTVELPLLESGFYRLPNRHTIRLGELLVLAGLMTESDMMYAVEIGLINEKPIGQVLVELQYISQEVLDAALMYQGQVSDGALKPMQAAKQLNEVHHYGKSATEKDVPKKEKPTTRVSVSLSQFLTLLGVVTEDDIKRSIEIGVDAPQILGRMLLLAGVIDEATLKAALRCYSLSREGILGTEQAFIAYNYSQHSGITIDEALQELGIVRTNQNKPGQ